MLRATLLTGPRGLPCARVVAPSSVVTTVVGRSRIRRSVATARSAGMACLVGIALLAFGMLAPAVPSHATVAGPGMSAATVAPYVVSPVSVDVLVGPAKDTRCRVAADLYLPATATPQNRQPAILTTHGFGGSKDDQAGMAGRLAERDYVVLAYSGLGFGGSQCKIGLDDPDWDGQAASQLVDYLAGNHPDVDGARLDVVALDGAGDPRVGMFGGSYGGQVQFAAASVDDRIDALVPAITWNDLAYSLAPTNAGVAGSDLDGVGVATDEPGTFKRMWADLFAALGVLRGVEHALGDPRRLTGCPNFGDEVCPALIEANLAGYPSPASLKLLRHASVSSYVSKVKAPTLLLQGQDDTLFNLQESVATYHALEAQGTPVRMVWQSWGHSGMTPAPGEIDLGGGRAPETTYEGRRVLDWFARWLRDDHTVPLGPKLAYFRDWVDYDAADPAGAEPAYGTADSLSSRHDPGPVPLRRQVTDPGAVGGRGWLADLGQPAGWSSLVVLGAAAGVGWRYRPMT